MISKHLVPKRHLFFKVSSTLTKLGSSSNSGYPNWMVSLWVTCISSGCLHISSCKQFIGPTSSHRVISARTIIKGVLYCGYWKNFAEKSKTKDEICWQGFVICTMGPILLVTLNIFKITLVGTFKLFCPIHQSILCWTFTYS